MLKDSLAMFTNHPTKRNLTEKYNSDKSLAESYHGRELLELVQNADDACLDIEKHQNDILIEYKGNSLRISNKGAIERLSQVSSDAPTLLLSSETSTATGKRPSTESPQRFARPSERSAPSPFTPEVRPSVWNTSPMPSAFRSGSERFRSGCLFS